MTRFYRRRADRVPVINGRMFEIFRKIMQVLIIPGPSIVVPVALSKEIGQLEAVALITMITEIQNGIMKDGRQMVALDIKRIAVLFPWCGTAAAKKLLESLRDRDFLFIYDETILEKDTTRWYALNDRKLRTLKSLVVMTDDEIEEAAIPKTVEVKALMPESASRMHQALFGAFIKACNFNQTLMTPRDRGETGQAVKKLIAADRAMYPNRETEDLVAAVEAFPVWWVKIEGAKFRGSPERNAPRPYTIISNWTRFIDYAKKNLGGQLPE